MALPRVIHNGTTTEYYFTERCYITEWLNSPQDADVSIAHVRLEVGITTKLHKLKGITERYVILAGTGCVIVGNLEREVVVPGDIVVIPSDIAQCITNIGNTDLIFLAICIPRFTQDIYEEL